MQEHAPTFSSDLLVISTTFRETAMWNDGLLPFCDGSLHIFVALMWGLALCFRRSIRDQEFGGIYCVVLKQK